MIVWAHSESVDGAVTYRLGNEGDVVIAEWPGLASYRGDREVRLVVMPGADPIRVTKLVNGTARALDHDRGGQPSLHAAAVACGDRALAFVGDSGAGKSTLAAAFVAAGFELLADDVACVVERGGAFEVLPGEQNHWLDARAVNALKRGGGAPGLVKAPNVAERVATKSSVLHAIIELVPGAACSIERIHGVDVMRALSTALFLVPPRTPGRVAAHLDRAATLARSTPTWRLTRTPDTDPHAMVSLVRRATFDADE